jgi:hypothetical protein
MNFSFGESEVKIVKNLLFPYRSGKIIDLKNTHITRFTGNV